MDYLDRKGKKNTDKGMNYLGRKYNTWISWQENKNTQRIDYFWRKDKRNKISRDLRGKRKKKTNIHKDERMTKEIFIKNEYFLVKESEGTFAKYEREVWFNTLREMKVMRWMSNKQKSKQINKKIHEKIRHCNEKKYLNKNSLFFILWLNQKRRKNENNEKKEQQYWRLNELQGKEMHHLKCKQKIAFYDSEN